MDFNSFKTIVIYLFFSSTVLLVKRGNSFQNSIVKMCTFYIQKNGIACWNGMLNVKEAIVLPEKLKLMTILREVLLRYLK